jgi:squalene-hopene/tetraprenyl-beta-curcumene cyclase
VTYLSVKALGRNIPGRESLSEAIKRSAFTHKHPFTGAKAGGWGWSDLPGAVPDADDTAGNLIALHILQEGKYCPEAEKGVQWLLDLQNKDGGMPTFCKGWGKLPFDRSSPDISAHSLAAFELWYNVLPEKMQRRCRKSIRRLLQWMKKAQAGDGSWTPLWFGDQDAPGEQAPVYGTAVTVEYTGKSGHPAAAGISACGVRYLLSAQNDDGGWGGDKGLPSKVTFTARTLSALTTAPDIPVEVIAKGLDYLYGRFKEGTLNRAEPIGLYFARLWYSEELYNITFSLSALKDIRKMNIFV